MIRRRRIRLSIFGLAAATFVVTQASALSLLPEAATTKSIVAPRFDIFNERLVGTWIQGPSHDQVQVEEVMRSCGGAVQGVREPNFHSDQGSSYLNRANDGFVFLDDGSYSCGPVKYSEKKAHKDDINISNFMLSETSRLTLFGANGEAIVRTKKQREDVVKQNSPSISEMRDHSLSEIAASISNISLQICSMPSVSQPWMLNRAKWQEHTKMASPSPVENEGESASYNPRPSNLDVNTSTSRTIEYWPVQSASSDEFYKWIGFDTHMGNPSSVVLHCGVVIEEEGCAKVIAREYDGATEQLVRVLFLQGAGIIDRSSRAQ